MAKTLELATRLSLQDGLSRPMSRLMQQMVRDTKAATGGINALSTAYTGAAKRLQEIERSANRAHKALAAMQKLNAGAAGIAAGAYVVSRPIASTMSFDRRLANMANTAYSDLDKTGRQAGMRELNQAIIQAVRKGGGDRESAATTLDTLIASGAMSTKDAIGLLPTLQKSATAANADPSELAGIAIRGMQTFGIKAEQLGRVLDMAITAGQAGGFELKDMAKWLPQQMAAAKLSGMSGMSGMAKLLAANQATAITAGTKDEAGNNLVNLLAKINSQDTAKDAKKVGINLSGSLAAARQKGIDSLDAFVGLVDHVVRGDKKYQVLKTKAANAKGDDQKAMYESMGDILQGTAIGKLIQDRQALMALVGIMNNRQYMTDILKKEMSNSGATDKNFGLIAETASYKTDRLKNEKAIAEQDAFGGISNKIGDVAAKLADYAQKYPGLTSALSLATTALMALSAAAGAAGLVSLLTGGRGRAAATAATAVAGSGAGTAARVASLAGGMPLAVGAGAAYSGYQAYEAYGRLSKLQAQETADRNARIARRAALEKKLQGYGGDSLVRATKQFDFQRLELLIENLEKKPVPVTVTVDLKNPNLTAQVNGENARQARRR